MEHFERIAQLIARSVNEELSEEEREELDDWIAESPKNLALVEEFRNESSLFKLMHEYEQVQEDIRLRVDMYPSEEITITTEKEETAQTESIGKNPNSLIGRYWWLAAAALVGIVIIYGVGQLFPKPVELLKRITQAGQIDSVLLSDKSMVILNGATSLSYPAEFTGDERHVSLIGEALFRILGNDDRPFTVEVAAQAPVKVMTKRSVFNLKGYKDSSQVITSLYSGEADVYKNNERVKVTAGKEVVMDNLGTYYTRPFDTTKVNWLCEVAEFGPKSIVASEIAKLGEWYNVDIVYPDTASISSIINSSTFITTLNKCDGLQGGLTQLKTIGLQFKVDGQKLIVTKSK